MIRRFVVRAIVMVAMAVLVPGLCSAASAFSFTGEGHSFVNGTEFQVIIYGAYHDEDGNLQFEPVKTIGPINPTEYIDTSMGMMEKFQFNGSASNGKTYLYGYGKTYYRFNGSDWYEYGWLDSVTMKIVN